MNRIETKMFNELKAIGAPVIERPTGDQDGPFVLSAENNYERVWADMYNEGNPSSTDDFGVDRECNAIVAAHGYYFEWINGGCLGCYVG